MNKNKVIHLLLIILCVSKITDVILVLFYNIGKISLEFDSAYYIFAGFPYTVTLSGIFLITPLPPPI